MAILYYFGDIKRNFGLKSRFLSYQFLHVGNGCQYLRAVFSTDLWIIRWCRQILQEVLCLLTAHARDRQTDLRTDARESDLNSRAFTSSLQSHRLENIWHWLAQHTILPLYSKATYKYKFRCIRKCKLLTPEFSL